MMNKEQILGKVELVGLGLVVVTVVLWIVPKSNMRLMASVGMAIGTVVLACGRFLQQPFYEKYPKHDPREFTLRRLYHQRVFGMVALILSVAMMFLPTGFYMGMYVTPSSWFVLFLIFVVTEVYTAFRISSVEKG